MKANISYSTRCNQSTDWTLQPKSLIPITLFSKHSHFPIQLYLFLQKFGTQGCLGMLVLPSAWSIALQKACRQNTKSQLESKTKPFTHSQANLQEVSTHECGKEMYAGSKSQFFIFFFLSREKKHSISEPMEHLWHVLFHLLHALLRHCSIHHRHSSFRPKQSAAHSWSSELSFFFFHSKYRI